MTHTGTIGTASLVAIVSAAALLGACIAAAVTWLVWWQGWGSWYPEAPFLLMLVAYSTASVLGPGSRRASLWGFAAAFIVSLVLMLVVGMTISEIIHCSFDRNGCFNL